MRHFVLLGVLLLGCGGSGAAAPAVSPGPPEPAGPDPIHTVAGWAVSWERTVGWLSSPPLFAADGSITTGGSRFDRDGRFLGLAPAHVPGGRMIAELVALLPDGTALAAATGGGEENQLIAVAPELPPEQARARAGVYVVAVDAAGDQVAVHTGDAIVRYRLPELAEIDRHPLASSVWDHGAVALVPGGAIAFVAPAAGCADPCRDRSLVVRDGATERFLVERGAGRVAFSPAGDTAAVWAGDQVRVLSLPGGDELGVFDLPASDDSALAVADGGRSLAAVRCAEVTLFERDDDGYRRAFRGSVRGEGKEGCLYTSGVAFSPGGDRLALTGRELTVLARGAAPAAAAPLAYAPELPAGFAARAEPVGALIYPHGSGLAATPRLHASYEQTGDHWAELRVVVRDARQLAGRDLDAWADALLVRFEPLLRGEPDPNVIDADDPELVPYRKAFVDDHGRRNLDYAILLHDGCEPNDRYVRYIEQGDQLVEITLQTSPGLGAKVVRPWLERFFDLPLGPAPKRVLASRFDRRGGC